MDKEPEILQKFEEILRNGDTNTYLNLYNSGGNAYNPISRLNNSISAKDILSTVENQIKAIQGADCVKRGRSVPRNSRMARKGSFLPVNMLPQYEKLPSPKATCTETRFETQCVTDSELVNLIQDAEAVDEHRGITQEFEASFCDVSDDDIIKSIENSDNAILDQTDNFNPNAKMNIGPDISSNVNVRDDYQRDEIVNSNFKDNIFREHGMDNPIDESTKKNEDVEFLACEDNVQNPENEDVILDSESLIIANEPVDLDNIPENYEVFSIPVTFETAYNVCDSPDSNPDNVNVVEIDEEISDEDSVDENPNIENRPEGKQGIPIIDISLKEPDPGKVIANIDLPETEFLNNEHCFLIEKNIIKKDVLRDQETNDVDTLQDIEMPSSLVFDIKVAHKKLDVPNSPEHLVVDLAAFEKFEDVALEALQNRSDTENTKSINSQILGKELCIQTDSEPVLSELELQTSEVKENDKNLVQFKNSDPSENKDAKDNPEVIKDEILFSSDEEEELSLNKVKITSTSQDLPLTCALETSFYEQLDILDKTLYVGFQTASNKSIQVSSESFYKAQSVFDDIEKQISGKEPTIIEMVENIDAEAKVSPDDLPVTTIRDLKENCDHESANVIDPDLNKKQTDDDIIPSQILPTKTVNKSHTTLDFRTASNKNIEFTDSSLEKAKKLFKDIVVFEPEEMIKEKIEDIRNKITSTIVNDLEENCQNGSVQNYNFIPESEENIADEPKGTFLTEEVINSGKESEEILFQDFNFDDISLLKDNVFDDCDFNEKMDIDDDTDNRREKRLPEFIINIDLAACFKTASNKCIDVSEEAIFKTRNVFNDIMSIELPNKQQSQLEIDTNNKNDSFSYKHDTNPPFTGLKTASNKNIKISDKALAKTKNIFNNIDSVKFPNVKSNKTDPQKINLHKEFSNPNTIGNKLNRALEITTSKVVENIENSSNINSESKIVSKINDKQFISFKTASNKQISVSKESLSKTKNIFQDIYKDSNDEHKIDAVKREQHTFEVKMAVSVHDQKATTFSDEKHNEPSFSGFKTASNRKIEISTEALSKTKKILNEIIFSDVSNATSPKRKSEDLIVGFQTASSKPVKISEEALTKSRKIFQEINNEAPKTDFDGNKFRGFQRACNKEVKISEKTPTEIKKVFQDHSNETSLTEVLSNNISKSSSPKFQGFKTASHKDVKISEKALTKSRKLFQDLDSKVPSNLAKGSPKFEGFKTASSKDIKVSEQALAKSRNLFQELDNQMQAHEPPDKISPSQKFRGFKTASRKEVQISEKALAKSIKLFKDLDVNVEMRKSDGTQESNNKFKGFKTASHEDLQISEKALVRSKKLFEDLDDWTTPTKRQAGSKFEGFQTGSNKKVTISPRALSRGRRILAELDSKENNKGETSKPSFGFQTASNKEVKISDAALAKSRKLFEDLDTEHESVDILKPTTPNKFKIYERDDKDSGYNFDKAKAIDKQHEGLKIFGFKTANNKKIKLSEEALVKSKNLFAEIEKDIVNANIETPKKTPESRDVNLESIINTQVLNNFEQSLHSEDFKRHIDDFKEKTPVTSKRSGSPILSCPRPKRRKFEIPYNQKAKIQKVCNQVEKDCSNKDFTKDVDGNQNTILKFNPNYKKAKTMTLKHLVELEKSSVSPKPDVEPYVTRFNFKNLLDFEFCDTRNDLNDKKLTTADIKNLFLNSVNKKFIPDGWIEIHLKLIIWKLLSYEIRFPKTMSGLCTVKNVIDQLKYRYDKELYNAERPALRKIMEKDDVASKTLILCVADIVQESADAASTKPQTTDLLLTDGWYTIRASTDKMLTRLVSEGKIAVGTKIATSGAELLGCDQGVAPWEDTSTVRLKISGNSTRPAQWQARLGYFVTRSGRYGSGVVGVALSAVTPEGGAVAKTRLLITRVYPPLYVEKFPDGSTVTRSERLEMQHQMIHEAERQHLLEKLYDEVERELSDQDSQDSDGADISAKRRCLETGSQIAKLVKKNRDPNEFRSNLSDSQKELLQAHTIKQREKLLQEIQTRVEDKMSKSGLNVTRNVVTLLKVRVVGIEEKKDVAVTRGILSIWKPNEELMDIIKEGAWIEVMNVLPTAIRNSEIQLSAGRHSVFLKSKFKESDRIKPFVRSLRRICYPIKELTRNPRMTTDYNEIDTIGLIFLIDPPIKEFDSKKFQFQNVYLADEDKNMISVNFWGGLKKYGVENLLETEQIISCANLQKRAGNTRKNIPQYRATEFSFFTKTPKCEDARKSMEDLRKKISNIDRDKFCEDCVNLKNNFAVIKPYGNTDVSPYRFQDINVSKNKIFIDSPLVRKKSDDDFNLSGLDFESTFKQSDTQDMSPKLLLRKRQINEKIAKLRMYGEPPPLSPIQILNKSINAVKAFKSPLLVTFSDTNVKSVANEKISVATTEKSVNDKLSENVENKIEPNLVNEEIQCSPVLNRTYVKKNVNPVRLNFSKSVAIDENDISDVVDQFGEDFDGSPPLSLD